MTELIILAESYVIKRDKNGKTSRITKEEKGWILA
jgi:hypothetical protein